jgi:hypothetical protein
MTVINIALLTPNIDTTKAESAGATVLPIVAAQSKKVTKIGGALWICCEPTEIASLNIQEVIKPKAKVIVKNQSGSCVVYNKMDNIIAIKSTVSSKGRVGTFITSKVTMSKPKMEGPQ